MIDFACPKCGMAYSKPDASGGEKFYCNNASCGQKIQVPFSQDDRTVGGIPLPKTTSPTRSGEWFYENNGKQAGPHTAADMKHLAKTGKLLPSTPVWTEGMADWQPANKAMPAVFGALAKKTIVVEETHEDDERAKSRWEAVGFAFFALVAAGILAALAIVLIPKLRSNKTEEVVKKDDDGSKPASTQQANNKPPVSQTLKPEEVFAKWKGSVALIRNRFGSGTGFLLDNRLIVTNSHVMEGDTLEGFELTFPSSANNTERYRFRMLYQDPKRDLAILQLNDKLSIPPLRVCATDAVEGEPIVIIGSPGVRESKDGLSVNAFCDGKVSNLRFEHKDGSTYIQHYSDAWKGNSGSPLLNLRGEVIAVHVAGTEDRDRVKLAIPLAALRAAIEKASGRNATDTARVAAMHDAHAVFTFLRTAGVSHSKGIDLVIEQTEELDAKSGTKGSANVGQVKRALVQVLRQQKKEFQADILHSTFVRTYDDRLNAVLANAALDEVLRRKLRDFRDEYLKLHDLFDSPPPVSASEFRQRRDFALGRLFRLADGIYPDFARDF